MYFGAFVVFFALGHLRIKSNPHVNNSGLVFDLMFYGCIGVLCGGRLGYCIFYGWEQLTDEPLWLFRIWEGGMSFHGGLIGVLIATYFCTRVRQMSFLHTTDFVAPLVPIGLGLGRIGNFINTELPGKVTEFALGVHFPCHAVRSHNMLCFEEWESTARHVSSLYQAFAEGFVLFIIVWWASRQTRAKGQISGLFLVTAGVLRFITEMFRQPDAELGYVLFEMVTMGQLLSVPVVIGGVCLLLPKTRQMILHTK